ncbi:MAG: IMP dehydrogenase [Candidatus Yanofskybacteria bacterium]|nr:IMP dehydrogenase [Candidatus Yanofskybacteria bacterium]
MHPQEILTQLARFRGITYRDVSLPPLGKNLAISRDAVTLNTHFSTNVPLKQPLVSANMLDVTESKMAIAQSLEGGIGIIHRFCPPDRQAQEAGTTKRAHNFLVEDPYSLQGSSTIGEARNMMALYKIGSLLVKNPDGKLAGLLTQRDVRFVDDRELVKTHMTPRRPGKEKRGDLVVVTREETLSINQIVEKLKQHKIKKLPVVDSDNFIVGLISAKDIERLKQYPLANLDQRGNLVVGATIGAIGDFIERAQELKKKNVDVIVMDVTSANSVSVENAIHEFRQKLGDYELVVGNIGTAEQAHALMQESVQGLKIGIGPGGPCTTRLSTGIGVPQLYAILEIYWKLIFKYHYKPEQIPPLCADGNIGAGCDIVHALLAGASSIMIGTLFAGTEETPGESYEKPDGRYKRYAGMASIEAAIERFTAMGFDDPIVEALKKAPEGIPREVKVGGSVKTTIRTLLGGVRSGISHRGILSLNDFKKQNPFDPETGFHILSAASRDESYKR